MWLFAAVSVAIATPCFRAWLEALFAELTIVFFNYLALWIAALSGVLALAIAFDCKKWMERRRGKADAGKHAPRARRHRPCRKCERIQEQAGKAETTTGATASKGSVGLPRVQWCRGCARPSMLLQVKTTTSEIAGSGFYPPQVWSMALLALTMLPIINSVMVGSGVVRTGAGNDRELAASSGSTLTTIEQQLTTCKYSDSDQCLNNVTSITALGTYKQAQGYCVAFDAAYVNLTVAGAGLPSQYYPIAVDDAYAEGYANNFSEWSATNQEKFQVDCPMLYDATVVKGGDELLCCTESQYEVLSMQIRELPALCPTCQQNLRNTWCQFTCNPSNSMFIDVHQVRLVEGDASHSNEVFPAIEEATYYVGSDVVRDIYDYCQADTAFASLLCSPTSNNCSDGKALLREMGTYRYGSIGSPSQVNFTTIEELSASEQQDKICSCNISNGKSGSSTDEGSDGEDAACFAPMNTRLASCADACGDLCAVSKDDNRTYLPACYDPEYFASSSSASWSGSNTSVTAMDSDSPASEWSSLVEYLAKNVQDADFTALNYLLVAIGFALACVLAAGVFYSTRYHKKKTPLTSIVDGRGSLIGAAATGASSIEDTQFFGTVDRSITFLLKRWGDFIATGNHPIFVIGAGVAGLIALSGGLCFLNIENDPVKMWTTESSEVYQQRLRFVDLFGRVPKSEQVVLVPKDGGVIGRTKYLEEAIRLQEIIANDILSVQSDDIASVGLSDICLTEGSSSLCRVTAITQAFQNRMDHFTVYANAGLDIQHLKFCVKFPGGYDTSVCEKLENAIGEDAIPSSMTNCPCLSSFGEPMDSPEAYLGGVPSTAAGNPSDLLQSTAMVSTALVQDHSNDGDSVIAQQIYQWEQAFVAQMKTEAEENALFDVYFSSQSSLEDEVSSESSAANVAKPVVVAYLLAAVFVTAKLNSFQPSPRYFVTSRFGISLFGVLYTGLSVTATMGIFAWLGTSFDFITLIGLPVLVLGVTVSHISSILDAVELKQSQLQDEQSLLFVNLEDNGYGIQEITCVLVAEALGECGSSIITKALVQSAIMLLGCIFGVPAVRLLAVSTGVAVLVSLVVFLTVFVGAVTLDKHRELSGRYDFLCCVRSPTNKEFRVSDDEVTNATDGTNSSGGCVGAHNQQPIGSRILDWYVNLLFRKVSKVVVLVIFTGSTLLSIVSIETLEWGMPTSEMLPKHSYVSDYLSAKSTYQDWITDPSVYFVVEGGYGQNAATFDVISDQDVQAKFCTSKDFCDEFSIPNILEAVVADVSGENTTYFKQGITMNSWLDEFWAFVSTENDCCQVDVDNRYAYIPAVDGGNTSAVMERAAATYCLPEGTDAALASPASSIPSESFMSLIAMYAAAPSSAACAFGAASRHFGEFSIDKAPAQYQLNRSAPIYLNGTAYGDSVTAFAYKLEAAAPRNSSNSMDKKLISGYAQARALAEWISDKTGVDVWVYSSSYGYLDQFRTVGRDVYLLMGLALSMLFAMYYVALGSFWLALAVTCVSGNSAIGVMGVMEPFGISLSAFTAVHAIIALVIAVEFSSQVVRAFGVARRDPNQPAIALTGDASAGSALRQELANLLFNSAIPKVVVFASLALASAGCFQTSGSSWRMLMCAVAVSFVNSVVLLPVVLSVVVDAAQGRVRDVKRTNEYGNQYERESPTASYYRPNPNGATFALNRDSEYGYGYGY